MSGHVEEDNLEKIPLNTVSLKSKQGVNLLREEISKLSPMNATFPLTGNISPEETGGVVNLHLVNRGLQVFIASSRTKGASFATLIERIQPARDIEDTQG